MNHRPKVLIIIAWLTALIALSMPAQVFWLYGHGLAEASLAFSKLTTLNWCVMAVGMLTAMALLRASRWCFAVVPLMIGTVTLNNWFVGIYATDFAPFQVDLATGSFALMHLPLLHPRVFKVLRHPEMRWWQRAERRKVVAPVFVAGARQAAFRAETFEISETGLFIPCDVTPQLNERVNLSLTLFDISLIRCEGRVVRRSDARGLYPAGIGIEFVELSHKAKRELKQFISRKGEPLVTI